MEVKRLLEERAVVGNEMNTLAAVQAKEDRPLNAEELERFDKLDNEFKALSERIETAKRVERASEVVQRKDSRNDVVTTSHRQPSLSYRDKEMAFKGWALRASGYNTQVRREHTEAIERCGFGPLTSNELSISLAEKPMETIERNQSSSVDSQGGYLMNDGLYQGLERNLKWFGGARSCARVIRSESGEPISFGYGDDTSNVGSWLGQNTAVTNTSLTYSKISLGEYTAVTSVYPVSLQVLQDARTDISTDIGTCLGERLGRLTNTAYTVGTGATQATGFMTDASLGKAAASASVVTYAELVDFFFSFDIAYRSDPSFCFTMADGTLSMLWKIVDGASRPLFWNQLNTLADTSPLTLFGKRIVINNDMPAIGASAKIIAGMVPSKFIIRDIKDAQVLVSKERWFDQLAVGFIAYLRTDSKLLNSNACKYLQLHS